MGRLRPEEISSILKGAITDYENRVRTEEVGQVLEVGDGIARVHGLTNVMYQEMVEFEDATGEKITGLALNLEEDNVGVIVAGDDTHIQEGNTVRRTERLASVPVGEGVLGRVIDALGRPMDGKGEIEAETFSADIRVTLDAATKGNVSFSSFSGQLDSDVPITTMSTGRRRSNNIEGTLQGGTGPRLRFHTFSGDVELRSR